MKEKWIKRWKSGGDLQKAAYLQEMAEQGLLLEDMGYYKFIFREGEPQSLQYRVEERENVPTEEEKAAYAEKGWQEVCHYETEYIFARERDPFMDDATVNAANISAKLDEKIELVKKDERNGRYGQFLIIGIGLIAAFFLFGFSDRTLHLAIQMLVRFLPWILLASLLSRRSVKKLQREKEEVLDGNISDDYTDWRKGRREAFILIGFLVIGLAVWVFYASDFNETTFDLPKEISYDEIPAVRLEMLTNEPLTRIGESIDPQKEGVYLSGAPWEGNVYRIQKKMGGFENYGVEYRYLLQTEEKVETKQCMQEAKLSETAKMETTYYRYRLEFLAERKYKKEEEDNMHGSGIYTGDEIYWQEGTVEFLDAEKEKLDDLHVCMVTSELGERLHILARQGKQLMEVKYSGNAEAEAILKEIDAVFSAQMK